ncbi:MAG: hypothetical protein ACR2G7_09170 [Acidimicrobiales bacterium]
MGLYAALDEGGAATSGQLEAWASVDERYAREWLEQQAVAGILQVDDPVVGARERVYRLPSPHREVLLGEVSPLYGHRSPTSWAACPRCSLTCSTPTAAATASPTLSTA